MSLVHGPLDAMSPGIARRANSRLIPPLQHRQPAAGLFQDGNIRVPYEGFAGLAPLSANLTGTALSLAPQATDQDSLGAKPWTCKKRKASAESS